MTGLLLEDGGCGVVLLESGVWWLSFWVSHYLSRPVTIITNHHLSTDSVHTVVDNWSIIRRRRMMRYNEIQRRRRLIRKYVCMVVIWRDGEQWWCTLWIDSSNLIIQWREPCKWAQSHVNHNLYSVSVLMSICMFACELIQLNVLFCVIYRNNSKNWMPKRKMSASQLFEMGTLWICEHNNY